MEARRISVDETMENGTDYKKGESGRIIESYFDDEKTVLRELKYLPYFGELLNYKYFVDKDFSELFNKMKEIKKAEPKLEILIKANLMSDKIENNQKKDETELSTIWSRKLENEGIIRVGDVHYRKIDFLKYFENTKNKK